MNSVLDACKVSEAAAKNRVSSGMSIHSCISSKYFELTVRG